LPTMHKMILSRQTE